MTSERIQRRIERLLDEADEAVAIFDWEAVVQRAEAVLRFDPDNEDAKAYLEAAKRDTTGVADEPSFPVDHKSDTASKSRAAQDAPTVFANGRYTVSRFLGEGGKKQVYLAQDTLLDRDERLW